MFVNTSGLTRQQTLQALYNHARAAQFRDYPGYVNTLSDTAAAEEVKCSKVGTKAPYRFDFVRGTPLWVDLASAERFHAGSYDLQYGDGAAQQAVDAFRLAIIPGSRPLAANRT